MSSPAYLFWIGTNSVRGSRGIYTVCAEPEDLRLHTLYTTEAYNSGALAYDPEHHRLFAASEGMVFLGRASGGVSDYRADRSGWLERISSACTAGQRPCSVAVDPGGANVYAANFFGGSLAMLPVAPDGVIGSPRFVASDPRREGWLHAMHCVSVLDGGRTVAALSVTRSSLVLYDAETGEETGSFCFGDRVFVRSLAACGSHIYVMIQDPGDIHVLRREGSSLELQQVVRMQPEPEDFYGTSVLRITPDGSLLLAGARRTNTIAVFRIDGSGNLTQTAAVPLPGETPRDFEVSPDGRIVVTALQASDRICVHRIDYRAGTLEPTGSLLSIPSPAAVAFCREGR